MRHVRVSAGLRFIRWSVRRPVRRAGCRMLCRQYLFGPGHEVLGRTLRHRLRAARGAVLFCGHVHGIRGPLLGGDVCHGVRQAR